MKSFTVRKANSLLAGVCGGLGDYSASTRRSSAWMGADLADGPRAHRLHHRRDHRPQRERSDLSASVPGKNVICIRRIPGEPKRKQAKNRACHL